MATLHGLFPGALSIKPSCRMKPCLCKHTVGFNAHSLIMKFSLTVISFAAFFSVISAVNVRYDTAYDNSRGSLSTITCSDGANGLLTKGFTTFDSLPLFPNIGAAQVVEGWNSTACGTCWQITYEGKSINIIAIDTTKDGFNPSLEAVNTLTNGRAEELGIVNAQVTQVAKSCCGL